MYVSLLLLLAPQIKAAHDAEQLKKEQEKEAAFQRKQAELTAKLNAELEEAKRALETRLKTEVQAVSSSSASSRCRKAQFEITPRSPISDGNRNPS